MNCINNMKFFVILGLCLCFVYSATLTEVSITPASYMISVTTTYYINIKFITNVPSGGYVSVIFPSMFTNLLQGTATCATSPSSSVVCSFSSTTLTVSGCFPFSSTTFALILYSVTNPIYAKTSTAFQVYTYTSANSLLDSQALGPNVVFIASTLSYAAFMVSGNAAEMSTWQISMTALYSIPSGGYVYINFPSYSSSLGTAPSSGGTSLTYCSGTITCKETLGLNADLSCSCTSSLLTIVIPQTFIGSLLISVTQLRNGPSTAGLGGFSVNTGYLDGYIEKSSDLTITISTPSSISLSSFEVQQSTIIYEKANYSIKFTTQTPIPQYSSIYITFTTDFSLIQISSITSIFGIKNPSFSINGNNVILSNGFSSEYLKENSNVMFIINGVINPSSTKPTSSLIVTVYDKNLYKIAQITSGIVVTASAGILNDVVISVLENQIGKKNCYTFSFVLNHPVPNGGSVFIVFPSEIVPDNTSGSCFYLPVGTALSADALCEITDGKNLKITNGFPNGNVTNIVILEINNVMNSLYPTVTGGFSIATYTDSKFEYKIDTFLGGPLQFSPGTIKSLLVEPKSLVTGDVTDYVLTFTTEKTIPMKSYIEVYIPPEISYGSISCSTILGFDSSVSCSINSNWLNITKGFEYQAFTSSQLQLDLSSLTNPLSTKATSFFKAYIKYQGLPIESREDVSIFVTSPHKLKSVSISSSSLTVNSISILTLSITPYNLLSATSLIITPPADILVANPTCLIITGLTSITCQSQSNQITAQVIGFSLTTDIQFTISGVTTPSSLKTSDSFSVFTYSDTYSIDYIDSGLALTMTQPTSFSSLSVSVKDSGISVTTDYIFTIKTSTTLPTGGYFTILLPSQISLTPSTSCLFETSTCQFSLSPSTITIYPPTPLVPSSFTITILYIQNPSQVGQSSNFLITTATYDNYLIESSNSLSVSFTCHTPCLTCFESADVCISCNQMFLYDNSCYTKCKTGFYDIGNYLCGQCSNVCAQCLGADDYCTQCIEGMYFLDYQCLDECPNGYYVNNSECLACDSGCKKCSQNSCDECSIGFLYYGTCVDVCNGFSQDNNCYNCSEGCNTCLDSASNCLTCDSSYYFYNNNCYSICPDLTYLINSTCFDCEFPCKSCKTSTYCTSCPSGYNLYDNSCIIECPSGYYSSNSICHKCKNSLCQSCDDENCYTCLNPYLLYNNSCLATCPLFTTVQVLTECIDCNSNCQTCLGSPDYCLSCPITSYLLQNQCLSTCPDNLIGYNKKCESCSSPCLTCNTTPYTCTSCESPYLLSNNKCLENCPVNTTIPTNNICEPCDPSCLYCSNSTDYCTICTSGISYYGTCLESCPLGYYEYAGSCIELCAPGCTFDLLNNTLCDEPCNIQACNYDNMTCNDNIISYANNLDLTQAPLPSSSAGAVTLGLSGASKYFVPSSSFLSSSVGLMSITETASWVNLAYRLSNSQSLHGRELLSDNQRIMIAFSMIIGFLGIHFIGNMIFVLVYYYKILMRDVALRRWSGEHKIMCGIVVTLSCLVSFKIIRIIISSFFGLKKCRANFEKMSRLYKPLLIMTYVSIGTTSIPIICLLIYIMSSYSSGNIVFNLALDSLITTCIVTLLSIPDIIIMHKLILEEKTKRKLPQFIVGNNSPFNEKIEVETFQVFDNKIYAENETMRTMLNLDGNQHDTEFDDKFKYHNEKDSENYITQDNFFDLENTSRGDNLIPEIPVGKINDSMPIITETSFAICEESKEENMKILQQSVGSIQVVDVIKDGVNDKDLEENIYGEYDEHHEELLGSSIEQGSREEIREAMGENHNITLENDVEMIRKSLDEKNEDEFGEAVKMEKFDRENEGNQERIQENEEKILDDEGGNKLGQREEVGEWEKKCEGDDLEKGPEGSMKNDDIRDMSVKSDEDLRVVDEGHEDRNMVLQESIEGDADNIEKLSYQETDMHNIGVLPLVTDDDKEPGLENSEVTENKAKISSLSIESPKNAILINEEPDDIKSTTLANKNSSKSVFPIPTNPEDNEDLIAPEDFNVDTNQPSNFFIMESAPQTCEQGFSPYHQPQNRNQILKIETFSTLPIFPICQVDPRPQSSPQISINDSISTPPPFEFSIFDSSKEFIDEDNEPQLLETIDEESELSLSSAEVDYYDLECIEVNHRPSGLKVLIKKNFSSAQLSNGEILENSNEYSIEEIDEKDVHFGLLHRSSSDTYLKARRSFKGAKIVDVELRGGIWLVGRTVRQEDDFDFQNARIGNTPDSVIAQHKMSGLDFQITKTFVGALDESNNVLEEYIDIPYIEEDDVHIGYIDGKKYTRCFVGGLVTAFTKQREESYQERPVTPQDRTAFFIKDEFPVKPNEEDEEFKFDKDEFFTTFTEGFFIKGENKSESDKSKPVSIEIQTDQILDEKAEVEKEEGNLSLIVLDSIFISPIRIQKDIKDKMITYEESIDKKKPQSPQSKQVPHRPQPKTQNFFKVRQDKFSDIPEVNDSSISSRSKTSAIRQKIIRKTKFVKKTPSQNSSKRSTPSNKSMRKSSNTSSMKSEDSRKSLEAIYLQRLRTPKDKTKRIKKTPSINAPESDSELALSIQMSLAKLNLISTPSQHIFEMIRKHE